MSFSVFLDRDGTICKEVNYLTRVEQLELLPHACEAIRLLKSANYKVIAITNQSAVARGYMDEKQLQTINTCLQKMLAAEGAELDAIYYCPHYPPSSETPEGPYAIDCDCRKPKTGMIEQARRDYHIDLSRSWLVGDTTTDIETAKRAGLRSILVRTGYGGRDAKYPCQPDYVCEDLRQAAELICSVMPDKI